LQFIDCVHQVWSQHPYAFEFNKQFLYDIIYHGHSCQFGSFLCNSYQEQMENKIRERTVSIWSYMNSQKEKYKNIYYTPIQELVKKKEKSSWRESDPQALKLLLEQSIEHNKSKENTPIKLDNLSSEDYLSEQFKLYPEILRPSLSIKRLRLWEEYFLQYSILAMPLGILSSEVAFQDDIREYLLLKKIRELKQEISNLKDILPTSELDSKEGVLNIQEESFLNGKISNPSASGDNKESTSTNSAIENHRLSDEDEKVSQ